MSKKQINDWRIKDFIPYRIEKEHLLEHVAYLHHEVDPACDLAPKKLPIAPLVRDNSTPKYLRKKGTNEIFIRTDILAKRKDMKPYNGPTAAIQRPNRSYLAEAIEYDEAGVLPPWELPLSDEVWVKIKDIYKLLLAASIKGTLQIRAYKVDADDLRKFFTERLGEWPKFLFLEKKDSEKEVEARGKKTAALFQPGLGWGDITVTLRDRDLVSIKTPTSEGRYSPAKLEMTDKRKGNQTKEVWRTLMLFCLKTGFVSSENTTGEKDLPGKAKRFNKAMQDLFNIKESIFNSHYKNMSEGLKCELKVAGYETKAQFRSSLSLNCSVEDYINESQDFDIEHPYKEYVSVDSLDDTEDE